MKTHKNLPSEFQEFAQSDEMSPPPGVSRSILDQVRQELNPGVIPVFSKLLFIHALTSIATLSVCPQFGFRVLGEGMGLMHWFMRFGEHGCLVACGTFFLGTSALIASFALRPEEVRKIREHRGLGIATVTLVSLGFFLMWDLEFVLSLTLAWFLGAWLGAGVLLELGWRLRIRWRRASPG